MNVRRPVPDDAEAVLAVLRGVDTAVAGDSDWTLSDVDMRVLWRAVIWEKELRAGG